MKIINWTGKNYLQNTNLTTDLYPDYTKQKPKKNSLKQWEGKQLNQKKKSNAFCKHFIKENIWMANMYKINIALGKCELEMQCNTIPHPLEWL